MATRRQQLSTDDLMRLRWLLGSVLALLSAWSVFFMDVDAWVLLAAITAASLAAIVRPAWPQRVPRWVHRLAFPGLLAAFAFDLYTSREPLPALLRLDLLLILYRLMMYRRRREDLQLVVLGLFLIVVGGVLSVSLGFAVQIVAFTGCALAFLLVIHLAEPDPGSYPTHGDSEPPAWTRAPWGDVLRRLQAAIDWRLVALGGGLFASVVLLSGLLFLAIPRIDFQSGLFLDRLISRQTLTGFSDTIEFGEVTAITEDGGLALTVDVTQPAALPPLPYWRMVVLDEYTGSGFRMSVAAREELARVTSRRVADGPRRLQPNPPEWTFYLEPGISRYVPLLGPYQRLVFTEPQTYGQHRSMLIVALQRDPPKMLPYRIVGMDVNGVLPDAGLALARRGGQRLEDYRQLPLSTADRDRLERLVRQIGAPEGDVNAFRERAIAWLERHHAYSLQSTLPPGDGDPLVRWADSATPGHCEYFAGAFVLLARAAGHPARLVTGFKGGAWNAYSGSFSVRNTNAHAWCEIFDDRSGAWLRADPTPGSAAATESVEDALAGGATRRTDTGWGARIESLRVFWYRRIVNFDEDAQLELATAARDALRRTGEQLRGWIEHQVNRAVDWLRRPWQVGRWLGLAVAAAALVTGLWVWRRVGRSWWLLWRSQLSRAVDRDPIRREAGRWLQRARRQPADRPAWPAELVGDLLRLRFGAPASWPDPTRVFAAARRAAKARVRPSASS